MYTFSAAARVPFQFITGRFSKKIPKHLHLPAITNFFPYPPDITIYVSKTSYPLPPYIKIPGRISKGRSGTSPPAPLSPPLPIFPFYNAFFPKAPEGTPPIHTLPIHASKNFASTNFHLPPTPTILISHIHPYTPPYQIPKNQSTIGKYLKIC